MLAAMPQHTAGGMSAKGMHSFLATLPLQERRRLRRRARPFVVPIASAIYPVFPANRIPIVPRRGLYIRGRSIENGVMGRIPHPFPVRAARLGAGRSGSGIACFNKRLTRYALGVHRSSLAYRHCFGLLHAAPIIGPLLERFLPAQGN